MPAADDLDPSLRLRNAVATLNNYDSDDMKVMEDFFVNCCSYGIYAKEVGKGTDDVPEGTPHLQIYFELKDQKSIKQIRKFTPHSIAHIKAGRAPNPKARAGYCKKGNHPEKPEGLEGEPDWYVKYWDNVESVDWHGFEWQKDNISCPRARTDLKEAAELVRKGEKSVLQVRADNPNTYHIYGRVLDALESDFLATLYRKWETKGLWIHGGPGAGKGCITFKKRKENGEYVHYWDPAKDYLWKYDGQGDQAWQDKYAGHEYVAINEFRGQLRLNDILRLVSADILDVRRRNVGTTPFLAKLVVINSIKPPKEVFKNELSDEPWEQFSRRFKVVEIKGEMDYIRLVDLACDNKLLSLWDKPTMS